MKHLIITAGIGAALVTGSLTDISPAHAEPSPCVASDGQPCAPEGPGCVNPDNSLPSSSSLPDAATQQEIQHGLHDGLLGL